MAYHQNMLSLLAEMGDHPRGTVFVLTAEESGGTFFRCIDHLGGTNFDMVVSLLSLGTAIKCALAPPPPVSDCFAGRCLMCRYRPTGS